MPKIILPGEIFSMKRVLFSINGIFLAFSRTLKPLSMFPVQKPFTAAGPMIFLADFRADINFTIQVSH
ncbi:MAG: hypothetical protein V9E88_00345 [Ferruginibacter sp.]